MLAVQVQSDAQQEQARSNRAQEALRAQELSETTRSHLANESLTKRNVEETERTNRANENIRSTANAIQSEMNRGTLKLRAQELSESVRSHKANEDISQQGVDINYADLTRKFEQLELARDELELKQAQLDELIRHNKASEDAAATSAEAAKIRAEIDEFLSSSKDRLQSSTANKTDVQSVNEALNAVTKILNILDRVLQGGI